MGEPIVAISHTEIFTIKVELWFDSHFQFFEWLISMHFGLESMYYNDNRCDDMLQSHFDYF